jgi:type II secretory pathway predicted ATPase ExeA
LYEEHFGLRARPFGEVSAYLPLPSREAVVRRMRYALEQAQGPAMLHGLPGVGKTRLARELAAQMGLRSVHLTFPALPTAELLAYLAEEMGCPLDPDAGAATTVRKLRTHLAAQAARGGPTLLIVDEAHLIADPGTYETLRLLLNFHSEGGPDLALVLIGGPELPLLVPEGLSDRMAARCLLRPLDEAETAAYVVGRMAAVGGQVDTFDAEALAALSRAGEGLPRRINHLADLGLLLAYAEAQSRVTAADIASAARELMAPSLAA